MTMRFEDTLPPGTVAEWSCGHTGGAVCAECYRILARKANELAAENLRLRDSLEDELRQKQTLLERLRNA